MKTALKSANYRYLEFSSSFDDHSGGQDVILASASSQNLGGMEHGLHLYLKKRLPQGDLDREDHPAGHGKRMV